MTRLADVLRLDNLYPHPERLVPFLGNHDTTRFLDGATSPNTLELAFTILTTMRGLPQIYSGDEIAMRGGADPDNRHDFPGGFGPTQDNAFNPAGRSPDQQKAFSSLKNLLALRNSHPALQTGTEQLLHADKNTLVYVRTLTNSAHGIQRTLVAVNKGSEAADVIIKTDETEIQNAQKSEVLLGPPNSISINTGTLTVHLAANAAVISDLD